MSPIPKHGLPGRLLRRLGRHPVAVVSSLALAVRIGRDGYRARSGEIDGAEFRARAGGHVGGLSGGLAGAAMGATAGSVVPGVGTIIGAFAGGLLGESYGGKLGRQGVERAEARWRARSSAATSNTGPCDADPEAGSR